VLEKDPAAQPVAEGRKKKKQDELGYNLHVAEEKRGANRSDEP